MCGRIRRGPDAPLARARDATVVRGYVENPESTMETAVDGRGLDSVVSGIISVNSKGTGELNA